MKKISYTILVLSLTLLAACSSNEQSSNNDKSQAATNQTEEDNGKSKDDGEVAVDKGLLSVEVTIPASMVESENTEETIASAKEQGIKEVTENEDGSVTYKMSKSVHKKLMNEIGTSIEETVEETINNEDFVSIKDISHNDSFSKFTVIVDKESYENSMDGFATITLGMSGMIYQIYDGADPEKYSVTISMKDEASGEVFDEIVYPDALDEQ
ncbi:hypothetical protein [Guptibacillus hwajinpoensis]|uniref:Major membrane immunogen (Membrane-anchored lipoprotein) n=1 Tax=Guptibacillus hwajinpoensis TaxID=208199 RepID=A0ABU0K1N3_9BACL|nr:hypothetical protein [Alkalihalobacillus hemicentroti]MDQ0483259.1 major membrane immunogen (membrane-anchored lipoprotein) [Alkalihalobacillus hemicentroti]